LARYNHWIVLLLSALVLCTVAFINGGPIIYPDSGLYLSDGERVLHLVVPLAVRPVFYGIAIFFLHWDRSVWPILIAQGLVVAHIVWLTYRVVETPLRPLPFLGVMAALAVLTPLSWHVSHVLPDVFAGVLILAMFLLGFARDRLGRWETVYLFLLSAASMCFHLTNLVIGLGLVVAIGAARLFWRPSRERARPLLAAGPFVLALVAFFTFSLGAFQRLTLAPNSPPHLMARLIMDGPGRDYLRAVCPTSDLAICPHLNEIPYDYEDFLWVFMDHLSYEDGKRVRAEESQVIKGTIAMFPAGVALHMLENTLLQLVALESVTDMSPKSWEQFRRYDTVLTRAAQGTLQSRGFLTLEALAPMNMLHAGVALVSFLACLGLLRPCLAARRYWPPALVFWVLLGLLANAAACGALSGVFGRYQGRVIWLLPMAAVSAGLAVARNRPPVRLRKLRGVRPAPAAAERGPG
jgi:hypothetical protein